MSTNIEFYERLKIQLEESQQWPGAYMFKFIVKQKKAKSEVLDLLEPYPAEYSEKTSQKGTYTSLTFKTTMVSPEQVISIYQAAEKIEGILML
ncbi:MAG: DUF493 family protein [Flavobacteriaceae bacterium]